MKTITNVSNVDDYSGETPVSIPSNAVTTVINDRPTCCACCCPTPCYCRKCSYCCCCCRCDYDRTEGCC